MLGEKIKGYAKTHKLILCAIIYFLVSASLSLTIFLRILTNPVEPLKYANAILYLTFYYLLSCIGSLILFINFLSPSSNIMKMGKYAQKILLGAILSLVIIFQIALILFKLLPDYISLVLFVPVTIALYIIQFKPKKNLFKNKATIVSILLISFCLLLPPLTANLSDLTVLGQISGMTSSEKSSYISDLIARVTFTPPSWLPSLYFRLSNNFQTYLITGVGACGEMAVSTSSFLNQSGIMSRTIGFPGEDHAFVEVYLNQTWYVLDPGYYHGEILTREQRAERRLNEMGAISYVISTDDSSFIDLTKYYVPVDNITLQILNNGKPVEGAQVYLEHTFMGNPWRLPNASLFFLTDNNGTILIHLGSLNYNSNADKVDCFFRVYVNGIDTTKTITSTGNQTQFIQIDIGNH